jgi:DNA-binding CsgD family transcriptional regulator
MRIHGVHIKIIDLLDLNSNSNIYCYDLNHRLIDLNEGQLNLLRQYGYKNKNDLTHETIVDKHPEFIHVIKENELVIKSGKAHQFFNKVVFKNTFALLVTIKTPTYDDDGKINGVFGISQIISENKIKQTNHKKMSERERQCILHILKGKTANQIANIMGLSSRTVESYIENIKDKLGCTSKSTLIEKILELGLANIDAESASTKFQPGIFLVPEDKSKNE